MTPSVDLLICRMAVLLLKINGSRRQVVADPDTPLLWILREHLRLTGTKFGCGIGVCGACTVHMDGTAYRSCQVRASQAQGKEITTIEGIAENHPVKRAWIEEQVAQCGYCTPGQIMQAAALLAENPKPTDDEIRTAMQGNLCRCGTYVRIRRAIRRITQGQP